MIAQKIEKKLKQLWNNGDKVKICFNYYNPMMEVLKLTNGISKQKTIKMVASLKNTFPHLHATPTWLSIYVLLE